MHGPQVKELAFSIAFSDWLIPDSNRHRNYMGFSGCSRPYVISTTSLPIIVIVIVQQCNSLCFRKRADFARRLPTLLQYIYLQCLLLCPIHEYICTYAAPFERASPLMPTNAHTSFSRPKVSGQWEMYV